jgi:hypothetical protein
MKKIAQIEYHFRQIMETLGLDLTDDSLKGTPKRVAKMYVKEIFSGLDPKINLLLHCLRTNINTMKCWWKKIFPSKTVSIILCQFLVRLMWLILLKVK